MITIYLLEICYYSLSFVLIHFWIISYAFSFNSSIVKLLLDMDSSDKAIASLIPTVNSRLSRTTKSSSFKGVSDVPLV